MGKKDDIIEINLGELFAVLLARAFLIISSGIFFALAGLFLSKFVIHPVYESTTKIYILNKEENQTVTYSDVQISTQLTQDYAELIKSRYVLEEVIQRLNLIDTTYDDLSEVLRVDTPSDTRIVAITAKDEDPLMAMKIANCIREVASEHITNVMDIDAINVAETANVPMEKSSPSVGRWTVIAGFLGAVLVAFFVVLEYLLDDTIKSNDDVERYLGMSTLALIPLTTEEMDKKKSKKSKHK
ncbi:MULTISPECIES: YveK family protein [unclassified Butyrivibrio]|jgi:capsular polysaccharide biosynthesis protein|uniref:YveK family protein n=1 Tax=unclassified Butyrivibrio TaxID=2639466 RepID=UPI0003B319AD|nr:MULTISPECIES: Wzz/FepE/Etk N-terminal domain-containing protein [unclassified Butyrivibrio]MDC7294846.1 Wzz/FepE/Etk N-terminal domain-containing protein [Butyrivibrio sp. DSM 10294]